MAVTGDARRGRGRRTRAALAWALLVVGVAVWFAELRPATLGGRTAYVIVSGRSMEPLMRNGDVAVVRRRPHYGRGDVVAYRIPADHAGAGMLVIHRIIGGNGALGYIVQGDNRDNPDIWRPNDEDVVGALRWHAPHLGTLLFLLRTPIVIGATAGFLAFWHVAMRVRPEPAQPEAPQPLDVAPVPPLVPLQPESPATAAMPARPASGSVRGRRSKARTTSLMAAAAVGWMLEAAWSDRR